MKIAVYMITKTYHIKAMNLVVYFQKIKKNKTKLYYRELEEK